METIIITTPTMAINYPFGIYAAENIPAINNLIDGFKTIEEFRGKNINFLCMGSSGAMIGLMFAMQIPNSKVIHIKKSGESSHNDYGHKIKALYFDTVNVIVDDFISTGSTVNQIYKSTEDIINVIDCVCVGSYKKTLEYLNFKPTYFVGQ